MRSEKFGRITHDGNAGFYAAAFDARTLVSMFYRLKHYDIFENGQGTNLPPITKKSFTANSNSDKAEKSAKILVCEDKSLNSRNDQNFTFVSIKIPSENFIF